MIVATATILYVLVLINGVYAETKKNDLWIKCNWKIFFIQACNFIDLPRMYDFFKFCLKLDKADTDIQKKYTLTDFKNGLVTATNVAIIKDIAK